MNECGTQWENCGRWWKQSGEWEKLGRNIYDGLFWWLHAICLFLGVRNFGHDGRLFLWLPWRDRRCLPGVWLVAAHRLRVRRERFHLPRIPHLDAWNRESWLHRVQPVQVADGALWLHGNVVSLIGMIKQLPADSDKSLRSDCAVLKWLRNFLSRLSKCFMLALSQFTRCCSMDIFERKSIILQRPFKLLSAVRLCAIFLTQNPLHISP